MTRINNLPGSDRKLARVHESGAGVWVDLLGENDNREGVIKALAFQVEAVQSDDPAMVLKLLASRSERQARSALFLNDSEESASAPSSSLHGRARRRS